MVAVWLLPATGWVALRAQGYASCMKLTIQERPAEMLFALLMAVSPIIGAIWVTPDVTKWIVLGVGVVMTLATLAVALRPVRQPPA